MICRTDNISSRYFQGRGPWNKVLHICVVAVFTLYSDYIQAQEAFPDSVALSEVVVRARKSYNPHQTINRKMVMTLPSSNVADALKYMTGVQIKDYGGLGGQKTINVRSLGSQHVGVYIDGVRVTNVQNGTVDLGKFSLSTLESVSLFNSNKNEALMTASEYASAATVYLQTHRPDSSSWMVSASAGSFGTYKAATTISYKKYGFIDASFTTSKGDYPFEYHTQYEDTTGTRRNSDIKMYRIEGCGFYEGFQLHAYYFNSERGLPGGVVRRLSDTYTDVGREWDKNFFTQLSWKERFGAVGVRGIVKYTNDYLHYRSDYPENISVHANNRYRQQDIYGAVASSYIINDWNVSVSTDYRWSDLVTDVRHFSYVYRLDSKSSLSLFYTNKALNASVSALYTRVTDHTRGSAKPLSKITYNGLISYTLGDWTMRGFYKSVFRTPTLNDLYYTLVGNRNLKPEYTKQLDLGFTYNNRWVDIQADGYYNKVEDRIVCLPLKGSYQWTMLNYGYTRCLGANVSINGKYKIHSMMLSATWQDDRNKTNPDGDDYNDYIAYSPKLSFTAVYSLIYRRFSASVSHIFVDKRYWTAENSIEDPLEAYNCTDLKMGYKYKNVVAEAECQNMLDERYEIIQRWPMPGRRYTLTLKCII